MKIYKHVPVYPETHKELIELAPEVAKYLGKKSASYNDIIEYLLFFYQTKKIGGDSNGK